MTLENQQKLANHIFRLLKVNELSIPIGRTNKGELAIKFRDGKDDFEVLLDSVPLSTKDILNDDNNIELKGLLEKYLFDSPLPKYSTMTTEHSLTISTPEVKKPRGRPKKK